MPYNIPKTVSKIYIHTGNVLNANELTQKAGQNATEEVRCLYLYDTTFYIIHNSLSSIQFQVVECLTNCLSKCPSPFALNEKTIHLKCDECYNSDNEEEYLALRTSVKIFLATNKADVLEDSLKNRKIKFHYITIVI